MPDGSQPTPATARFLWLAVLSEAGLGLGAVAWILWRQLPLAILTDVSDVGRGAAVAVALAVCNVGVLRYGPNVRPVRSVRRFYERVLRPLFERLRPLQIVGLSAAAGVGEELLFRGAVQPELGLVAASVLFGLVHIGGADMIAFGVWAAAVGALLGWLASATGGLLAPMTAHAVYDALVLVYIVWVPRDRAAPDQHREEPLP